MTDEMATVEGEYVDFVTDQEDGVMGPRKNVGLTDLAGCLEGLHQWHRRVSLKAGNLIRKLPDIRRVRPIEHLCERRVPLRMCGICWFPMLGFFTLFWGFWWLCLLGLVKGDPLKNDELMETMHDLVARNSTFTEVCRFKDWTYFIGSTIGKVFNHHGALLAITNSSGLPEGFLQLEYGARGTFWQMGTAPHPDPRYGITAREKVGPISCRYKCGTVAASQQDPKRLLWFLEKYRDRPYNIFYYTCVTFAEMIYNFHMPQNEQCFSTAEMDFRFEKVTRSVQR